MTSRVRLAILCIGLCGLFPPAKAFAWGRDGHRIVCAIAWDEITPKTRSRVQRILDIETKEQFAPLCNWADQYRGEHLETSGWHFVDVPDGARSVDPRRDCAGEDSCALAQIAEETRALQRRNRSADKAMALKLLIHFVGDIHQPLHAGFVRDQGGVKYKGKFLGRDMHMHRVWDSGIIGTDGRKWTQIATDLEREITGANRRAWKKSKPLDWANESFGIAIAPTTQYAVHGESFDLGEDYAKQNLPVVLERLKRAGVRLGALLNSTLQ